MSEFVTENGHTAKTRSGKFSYIYEMFRSMFPDIASMATRWGRYDEAGIEIRVGHKEYIFSWKDNDNWCLQTKKNYMRMFSGRN